MEVTFEINTYEGDALIVSLSSSYDYKDLFVYRMLRRTGRRAMM